MKFRQALYKICVHKLRDACTDVRTQTRTTQKHNVSCTVLVVAEAQKQLIIIMICEFTINFFYNKHFYNTPIYDYFSSF